jgi:hypothetical protein
MNNFTNVQLQFTNKQNLNLLWNVLLDEFNINKSNQSLINNIKFVFESNINPFISRANPKSNIMELNKNFLAQVVLAVNKLFPNFTSFNEVRQNQEQHIKRITISDEDVLNEPYKIEDIQASRQTEFDKNVEQKRIDMENYMIPQKPKELDFTDKNYDVKITSMDSLIAEKMAQRNLEIEQLQHNNFNTTISTENWLTPKETSLKNDKTVFEQKSIIKNNENGRLKHISIDSNNNITLSINETEEKTQNISKKVSWDDSAEQKEPSINIFNKLKKQNIIETNQDDNINMDNEKQYVEQKSMALPNIKQEEIIRNQSTLIMSNNEPILPKTEIIKQLNEMNKKIDNLYEIVFKLTSFIEKNNKEESLDTLKTLETL